MPDHLRALLKQIPQQPQRQDSTTDQLADLHTFAADAIKAIIHRK